eukprot:scaffold7414_cov116-Cylindrotheca_fusiformis.AAC.5
MGLVCLDSILDSEAWVCESSAKADVLATIANLLHIFEGVSCRDIIADVKRSCFTKLVLLCY